MTTGPSRQPRVPFVARHEHAADRCPAKDLGWARCSSIPPRRTPGGTASRFTALDGRHTLGLIAGADDRDRLEEFLEPFPMAGTVEVWPAPDCAAVEGGGCETAQLSPLPAR